MKRHNQILIGILIVQIAVSAFIFWPQSTVAVESEPLFGELKADDMAALTITDGEGNAIQLKKVDGDWALPNADNYPARADKIDPLLQKLVGLTTDRLVTRTDTSHRRLQVAPSDFVRRIELETSAGERHTLYLGSSPRYGATHFRLEGQSETYLTDELTAWEANASAVTWIDTAYVRVPQEDVERMTLENANGEFVFKKDDEGNWTMDGLDADEALDETQVTSLLRPASSVNMTEPLGTEKQADYGLDEPAAVVALETVTKTVTLQVGAQDPDDNSYVVKSSESPYYVRVSEASVKALVERTRQSFLQKPPTPTSEAESDRS